MKHPKAKTLIDFCDRYDHVIVWFQDAETHERVRLNGESVLEFSETGFRAIVVAAGQSALDATIAWNAVYMMHEDDKAFADVAWWLGGDEGRSPATGMLRRTLRAAALQARLPRGWRVIEGGATNAVEDAPPAKRTSVYPR